MPQTNEELQERIHELEATVESLERRLTEIEGQHGGNNPPTTENGLDRFDAAIIEYVEENGSVGPRECVALYKKSTAISQEKTAQRRAKQLRQSERYKEAVA